eukprot:TRINITY_DN5148_c0_g1_i1.p1 TRINITY_DN5148_c0_g1~~TRINITY_DN5148_c0_g1_i1.p1  ORF type:complete len:282 (+),score=40.96 TRINITY_DN5148_c0_g1_i1:73-918(+)
MSDGDISNTNGNPNAALHPPIPCEWTCLLYSDMSVAVCEWGTREAARNILLIHGWMDSAASFYRLAPILSKRIPSARLVAIDLPGHGKSSHRPPGSFYYFTDYIGDVHAFVVNHLKWTHFDIIGHSMGGNVGMLFSAAFPEMVHRLIMIDILGPIPTLAPTQATVQLRKGILERSQALEQVQKGPKLYNSIDETVSRLQASEWTSSMRTDSLRVLVGRQVKKITKVNDETNETKDYYVFIHDTKLRASPPARLSEEHIYAYASAIKCQVLIIGTMGSRSYK